MGAVPVIFVVLIPFVQRMGTCFPEGAATLIAGWDEPVDLNFCLLMQP